MALAKTFESSSEIKKFLCERLLDQTQPISERFRALFSLRNLHGSGPRKALILATRDSSNLLAHEAAFALGQMQDVEAVPALEKTLGLDPTQVVRETCELALEIIEQQKNVCHNEDSTNEVESPFLSVDPATPASCCSSIYQLREVLLDEERGMYQRYAALFALRNRCEDVVASAIVDSLGARSALLRHEVAYVLGQLQNKATTAALSRVLKNISEHPMVRHEAAEALGSIANSKSVELPEEFANDDEPTVSQSWEVALRMLEFERSGKSFEYLFM
ncbi:hypothetical protein IFM89_024199 [Coptis chinensis]|uniref:Deoxyhypusine monooxygenase n=1 Tax=Coptis chinensis TaxID=261450 RepID=A0A835H777_9MAGN|nr:hypothetical protein IFM89_024199 [Coptis chinensis]